MKIHIHQTHHTIGDFEQIFNYLKDQKFEEGIHLFPELFLSGYPLQDLCLQKEFYQKYLNFIAELKDWIKSSGSISNKVLLLMGGLHYYFDENDLPQNIENVIYALTPGPDIEKVYTKRLPPNYDIFDEKKYFTEGKEVGTYKFLDKNLALLICEDMWVSHTHDADPVEELVKLDEDFDLIINLSASPNHLGKHDKRISRASEISNYLEAPLVYVNRVGGEDEILFDGSSFVVNADEVLLQAKSFSADSHEIQLPSKVKYANNKISQIENTWESLFSPTLDFKTTPIRMQELKKEDLNELLFSLQFGVREYARKCGFKKFLVALSGGIDSGVVLTLMKLFLKEGEELEAVYMPSKFSETLSYELSRDLCNNLGVKLKTLPIKFFHSAIGNASNETFSSPLEGLSDENIQSRLRGALIYARSNQTNAMVINTSNKSELAVGYSTLYGDSVGAISMLGDLYKSEVFALANYINDVYDNIIPPEMISRPPTAELREDQKDEHSLPPYDRLDPILEGLLSYRLDRTDLINYGHREEEVDLAINLYKRSEYKRRQFCPIIKLKPKSFGFGYRIPITKR